MYERRHETWRRLNRDRVAAFVELFVLAMVRVENAHRSGQQPQVTTNMLNKALVKRVISWTFHHRAWTMDDTLWPISLEHFKELDNHLTSHLPRVHADYKWKAIQYFF